MRYEKQLNRQREVQSGRGDNKEGRWGRGSVKDNIEEGRAREDEGEQRNGERQRKEQRV